MSITKKPKPRPETVVDRPFSAGILKRAKVIAERYQVVMWFEDGEFYGQGVELPGAGGDGKTPDQCMSSTRESLTALVAYMLEMGEKPPAPFKAAGKMASRI
jgi:predicted RNase H-like HicB family nuclease